MTTFFIEPGNRLTVINNSSPRNVREVEEIGVATFKYGRNVLRLTIGVGARKNRSRDSRCYECEEGNKFHFVLMLCKLIFMEKKSGDFTFCNFFFQGSKEKVGKLRRLLVVLVVSNFSLYRRRGDSVLGILVKQCTINPGPCINQDIYQAHPSLSYGKWRHDKVFAAVIKDSNLQRCSKCTIPSICSFRKSLRLIQVFFWLRLAVNTYFFEWAS